jgi:arylsulfatase A-like enzyme
MVRDERFKLIRYSVRGKKRDQLFDLRKDPFEKTDLSEETEYAEVKARLALALKDWQKRTEDPHEF